MPSIRRARSRPAPAVVPARAPPREIQSRTALSPALRPPHRIPRLRNPPHPSSCISLQRPSLTLFLTGKQFGIVVAERRREHAKILEPDILPAQLVTIALTSGIAEKTEDCVFARTPEELSRFQLFQHGKLLL